MLAEAALRLVGCPFRLQGRNPDYGLDCIGLLSASLAAIGRPVDLPSGYSLRNRSVAGLLPEPESLGFRPALLPGEPGDVALWQLSPVQFHLAIAAPASGWIHAHAGLRRVVCQPGPLSGSIDHHWRLADAVQG